MADELRAALLAGTHGKDVSLTALEPKVPASMHTWRDDIAGKPPIATDSAGAFWVWSRAAEDADTSPANVRASETVNGKAMTYYTSQGAGNVAATVNVGHRVTNYGSVNGIVARFQAYAAAQVVLLDTPSFPDVSGKPRDTPEGYTPRRG